MGLPVKLFMDEGSLGLLCFKLQIPGRCCWDSAKCMHCISYLVPLRMCCVSRLANMAFIKMDKPEAHLASLTETCNTVGSTGISVL